MDSPESASTGIDQNRLLEKSDRRIRQLIQDGGRPTVPADQRYCAFSQGFFLILRLVPGADQAFGFVIPVAQVKRASAMQAAVGDHDLAAVGELKEEVGLFPGYDEIVFGRVESYDKQDL